MTRILLALFLLASPAAAQVPMEGRFVAEATCAATPAIRDPANPGDFATEAGRSYDLVGRNAVPGSHYLLLIPEAEPQRRWVPYGCGRIEGESVQFGEGRAPPAIAPAAPAQDDYVLAVSWHPAFCETRPRVRECRDGGRADAGFALHGLWPQPIGRDYCGVPASIVEADEAGDWRALPDMRLSVATRTALAAAMPGVASGLDRHEWWKHGTCFSGDEEGYFALSLRLLGELNDSGVAALFARSIGDVLTGSEVRASFDAAFGAGAGERVLLDCAETDERRLIRELRIALSGAAADRLADMIFAAEPSSPGCRAGEVDAAGLSG